ncbi:hypothetical protein ABU162_17060 [Paenibacillus thiaminolyticus]|uniref:hypothetical protein n=1 Tax=Paenibacillus thiaminolyticus TaxID=49283 RepID=UPI0035A6AF1F
MKKMEESLQKPSGSFLRRIKFGIAIMQWIKNKELIHERRDAFLAIRDALERNGDVTEHDIGFLATGRTRETYFCLALPVWCMQRPGCPLWKLHRIPGYVRVECMRLKMLMYISNLVSTKQPSHVPVSF